MSNEKHIKQEVEQLFQEARDLVPNDLTQIFDELWDVVNSYPFDERKWRLLANTTRLLVETLKSLKVGNE